MKFKLNNSITTCMQLATLFFQHRDFFEKEFLLN